MSHSITDALPSGISVYGYTLQDAVKRTADCISYRALHNLLQEEVLVHEFFPQSCAGRDPESMLVLPLAGQEEAYAAALQTFGERIRVHAATWNPQIAAVQYAHSEDGLTFCVQRLPQGTGVFESLTANPGDAVVRKVLGQAVSLLQQAVDKGIPVTHLSPLVCYMNAEQKLCIDLFAEESLDASSGYVALECVQRTGTVGERAAVYALGAMMYCLIMGQTPQPSNKRIGRTDSYVPLASHPSLKTLYRDDLLAGIDKALSLWAEDRWPSFAAWGDELNAE